MRMLRRNRKNGRFAGQCPCCEFDFVGKAAERRQYEKEIDAELHDSPADIQSEWNVDTYDVFEEEWNNHSTFLLWLAKMRESEDFVRGYFRRIEP